MKIGKIISVEYDKFRVKLFHTTKNSSVNIDGKVYYFGNIGSYLKTINSSGEYILCEVSSIVDWIGTENNIYSTFNLDSSREIIIKPIGTLKYDKFSMGVGIFPSLYSDVEIVTYDDLDKILSFNEDDNRKGIHSRITIGKSKSLINYDISLDINRLFNIHTAVLGNSGSGKSNTIAHILHEVYRKENNYARGAKTIIFDANGEYPIAFTEEAELDKSISSRFYKPNISSDNIHQAFVLPYYLMNTDEWLSFLLASERTQKPFWDKVLQESYKFYKIFNSKDKEVITKFVNYIKWKLYKILFNIVTRVDSDTSKMTAAKGAISMMEKDPNLAVGLANSALESIIKEILKDERLQVEYNDKDTLSKLIKNICKAFRFNNDTSLPQEVQTMAKSLIACSCAIEDLRSTKTEMHGKTQDDFIIKDPMCAYFVVNAVSTVGLFLLNYYMGKYPRQVDNARYEFDPDDDLPF